MNGKILDLEMRAAQSGLAVVSPAGPTPPPPGNPTPGLQQKPFVGLRPSVAAIKALSGPSGDNQAL